MPRDNAPPTIAVGSLVVCASRAPRNNYDVFRVANLEPRAGGEWAYLEFLSGHRAMSCPARQLRVISSVDAAALPDLVLGEPTPDEVKSLNFDKRYLLSERDLGRAV